MGRPTKLGKLNLEAVKLLASKGLTNVEFAKVAGVTEKTIYNWQNKNKEFLQALKEGKEISDGNVKRCLYERACGYETPDIHFSSYEGVVTQTPYIKKYAPDPTSMIFWLKNRLPDEFSDKQEHRHSGEMAVKHVYKLPEKEG